MKPQILGITLILQVFFGLNYIASKQVLGFFPPLIWAAMRALFTSGVLLTFLFLRHQLELARAVRHLKPILTLALLSIVLNQGFFLWGLRLTTTYNSALINTLIPVFTLLIACLKKHEHLTLKQAASFALAITGILSLTPLSQFNFSNQFFLGNLFTLCNVIAYSSFLVLGKEFLRNHPPLWVTAWVFFVGGILMSFLSFTELKDLPQAVPPLSVLLAGAYGLIGGTLLPYLLLAFTLTQSKASTVALFSYLQPIIVGGISCLLMHEPFTQRTLFATLFILSGVLLSIFSAKSSASTLSPKLDNGPKE